MAVEQFTKARRRIAWIALFALLLQAILPAVHHPAGMAFAGPASLDGADLCLAPGSTPPASVPDKAPSHKLPICQTLQMLGGFVPPNAVTIARVAAHSQVAAFSADTPVLSRRAASCVRARGPPLSA